MTPFVQGAIAAATTACLYRQITSAKETQKVLENIALGANHLFLVANAALIQGSIRIPGFSLCAKAVFLLTPVVLVASFYDNRKITSIEKSRAHRFGQFYYLTTFVSSVALLALGNREYGTAALSVLAFDWVVHQKQCPGPILAAFTVFFRMTAVATFIGFAARLSTALGHTMISLIGMVVFLPKIAKVLAEIDSDDKEVPYVRKGRYRDPKDRCMDGRYGQYGRECYHCPPACIPQQPLPSGRSSSEGASFKKTAGSMVTPLAFEDL